jgi:hypothetical protein
VCLFNGDDQSQSVESGGAQKDMGDGGKRKGRSIPQGEPIISNFAPSTSCVFYSPREMEKKGSKRKKVRKGALVWITVPIDRIPEQYKLTTHCDTQASDQRSRGLFSFLYLHLIQKGSLELCVWLIVVGLGLRAAVPEI